MFSKLKGPGLILLSLMCCMVGRSFAQENHALSPSGIDGLWLISAPDSSWVFFERSSETTVASDLQTEGPFADLKSTLTEQGLYLDSVGLIAGELGATNGSRRVVHGFLLHGIALENNGSADSLLIVLESHSSIEQAQGRIGELELIAEDVLEAELLQTTNGDEILPDPGAGDEASACVDCPGASRSS